MMDNPSVGGGGVNYRSAAGGDSHMSGYNHNISCLNVREVINPGITSYIPPSGGGDVALVYAYLVEAPVNKTGAVKGIWSLGAPYIGTPQL